MLARINGYNPTSNNRAMNKTSSNTFGLTEFVCVTTDLAYYSKKIHELRKSHWFYKMFPSLNKPPKIIEESFRRYNIRTKLVGEDELSVYDNKLMVADLKRECDKLAKRFPIKKDKPVSQSSSSTSSKTFL